MDFIVKLSEIDDEVKDLENSGVGAIVIPAVKRKNFDDVIGFSKKNPKCFFALGYHPLFIGEYEIGDLEILSNYLSKYNPVAVGEIGLDFSIKKDNIVEQESIFYEQLKLANFFNLPTIIHARGSIDRILKYLRLTKVKGGIIHAFNGSFQQAKQLIELGFKLGFGGAMTYDRATHIRDLAKNLPVDAIVLETDSPDMPPSWLHNGTSNHPKELRKIAEFLCELRGVEPLKLAEIIRVNTTKALPKLGELCT